MPYNFALTVFTERNFVADFFKRNAILGGKTAVVFLSPSLKELVQRTMLIS